MPVIVLVTQSGARVAVKVARPGLSVQYRHQDRVVWFDLLSVDQGLRMIYKQRVDGVSPRGASGSDG